MDLRFILAGVIRAQRKRLTIDRVQIPFLAVLVDAVLDAGNAEAARRAAQADLLADLPNSSSLR